MKIAIAGGTGFVGSKLTDYFLDQGHQVFVLTRSHKTAFSNQNLTFVKWLSADDHNTSEKLEGIDAFINLAGESINSGRWTEERKNRIKESRITTTREVISLLSTLTKKPKVLVNASAIGVYGTSLTDTYTEDTSKVGTDFLANTVYAWEQEAKKAEQIGVRVALVRLGIVLGDNKGALPKMVLPYRLFIGGKIGRGNQWLSWIHIDDVVRSIEFIITNNYISGPVNLTAPSPFQMNDFGKTIGAVLTRPHWLPVPSFALKILLGEMSILILEGQKVLPQKLLENNYTFKHNNLKQALTSILK